MKYNVQIASPKLNKEQADVPIVWAQLKTHHKLNSSSYEEFNWRKPILNLDEPDLTASSIDYKVDVLGLSCYSWSSKLNYRFAREIKRRNPNVLIIAGGPDIPYKEQAFFQQEDYIDAYVPNDGEITFTKILEQFAAGEVDLHSIPGLILPNEDRSFYISTGPAEMLRKWNYSGILEERDYCADILRKGKEQGKWTNVFFETTRGCPYSCSFCDWGGGIMTKIRQKDIELVKAEIDFAAEMQVDCLYCVDANFGIMPRDPEITDYIIENWKTKGGPKSFYFNSAKNQTERGIYISRELFRAGLIDTHNISIQDPNKEVLRAIDRENLPPEKQIYIANTLRQDGVPIKTDFILGLPGQTTSSVRDSIAQLYDSGFHEFIMLHAFEVLPNAPAGDPAYKQLMGIETVSRPASWRSRLKPGADKTGEEDASLHAEETQVAVTSYSFDRAEWAEIMIEANSTVCLHSLGVLRNVAVYLHEVYGVSYKDFYKLVHDNILTNPEHPTFYNGYLKLQDHFRKFADQSVPGMTFEIDFDNPEFRHSSDISMWIGFLWLRNKNELYNILPHYLNELVQIDGVIKDLLHYNQEMLPDVDYDPTVGRPIKTKYDWYSMFNQYFTGGLKMPNLKVMADNEMYYVTDTNTGNLSQRKHKKIDWHQWHDNHNLREWFFYMRTCLYWHNDRLFRDIEYVNLKDNKYEQQPQLSAI